MNDPAAAIFDLSADFFRTLNDLRNTRRLLYILFINIRFVFNILILPIPRIIPAFCHILFYLVSVLIFQQSRKLIILTACRQQKPRK